MQGPKDPFNELYTGSTIQALSTVDKEQLDALGFHTLSPVTTVIEAFGSTSLTQVGNNFYFYGNSSGTGPEFQYAGAAVVANEFGGWAPIGAEQTASGNEVAWHNPGTGQYTGWNTDSNGIEVSKNIGFVLGTSNALESLEPSFHQDLNGDGVIGVPAASAVASLQVSAVLGRAGNDTFAFHA